MKKPKIRFKGFTEDWEQRKVSEIADRYDNLRVPVVASERVSGSTPYYGANGIQDYVDGYTHDGEFVLIAEDGANDLKNYPVQYTTGKIWVNNHAHVLQGKEKITDNKFLGYSINATNIESLLVGGGRAKLNAEVLMGIELLLPSYLEQCRISEFLFNLDNLITLHQRKCDDTQKLKKYMLQKMFPKNGATVPEIRFSGFTEDWEQRKLNEVMSCVTDYVAAGSFADIRNNVTYLSEPDYAQLVRTVDLKKKFSNNDFVFVDRKAFDYLWRVNLNEECIVLPNIGANIGEVYYVEPSNLPQENNVLGPNAILLKTDEDKYFVFTSLTTDDFQSQLFENVGSSGQPKFNKTELKNINLRIPSLDEQHKIGEVFRNIDNLITLHQWKCKKSRLISKNDWEQRKLGDVVDVRSGRDYKHLEDGDIPVYGTGGYMLSVNEALSDDEDAVGIGRKGTIDNPYILKAPFWTVDTLFYAVPREKYDLNFIYSIFQNVNWKAKDESTGVPSLSKATINAVSTMTPGYEEQRKIGEYFSNLDTLITLHQCKPYRLKKMMGIDWEQRKLSEIADKVTEKNKNNEFDEPFTNSAEQGIISQKDYFDRDIVNEENLGNYYIVRNDDFVYNPRISVTAPVGPINRNRLGRNGVMSPLYTVFRTKDVEPLYLEYYFKTTAWHRFMKLNGDSGARFDRFTISSQIFMEMPIPYPCIEEQNKVGRYFDELEKLITLHQREVKLAEKAFIYTEIQLFVVKEITNMAELEALIEQKLIDQLVYGDSQWTYRQDLKTEADLWNNFRYILEQNNKDRLNGEPLTDAEFDQVKNQLQFSSFYKAGEWLVGENGKVMVHVQRDTEKLHLVVMNHEHIAGGSSVYEVINQYQALDTDGNSTMPARDRRFDVTLMINGLPMIHIELKNKQHPYMDGFRQIKKYIGEGKFTGIFSAVQMFVVSNGVDTKYFAAASDRELNDKFLSGWVDNDNNPVTDYLDFAKSVLRIPQAHEMIARYTVLDEDAKRLIILRPYQIHAIEAIRDASKNGKSGFVWHTTGSGKTLTSYKATRNLLMDIPSLDKTIFLIDRKDLDTQTTQAFQAYANNDLIDVDETDNVFDLKNKLKSDDRQVIVTTIQKLQILITKRLKEGTPEYDKIKDRRIAFVVDECHRAVTPNTKRLIERFFGRSLWYGFTGTPRFAENPYPQMGDLPRTTEELYGERLHRYTIQNAIHDNAVLGFQVEHNGPKNVEDETDVAIYDNETHMLSVLEIILNRSFNKLGFQNGKGKTYEGLLTVSSIQLAQKYYDLLTRVKNGETSLVIDEKIKQVLPDFPKFAITYSVSENAEGSQVNQQKMQKSLDDYNGMFGTKYDLAQIQGYNANLNKRLARKDHKYDSRNEQLDLVIVVDRLLTGFDAPCMSTIFIDRQPMGPHDLIQAFSRTNRIFDKNKVYGQIVTFQAPVLFKEAVDTAVKLYSAGGTKDALMAEWDEVEPAFRKSLAALKVTAESPADIPGLSKKEKKIFVKIFQEFDRLFSQVKSFTVYDESMLEEYGITQQEYDDYAGHYKNVVEELKDDQPDKTDDPEDPPIDSEYELMAYSNTKIDYEYIINLIQNIVTPENSDGEITPEERQKKIDEVKQYVDELRKENPKVAEIMSNLIDEIETDDSKYKGQSILNIIENTKEECIDKVITDFCLIWYASKEEVMYAATHYRNGEIPNESAIKATIDFTSYKAAQERALPKFKYYAQMMAELKKTLDEEIKPLITR